MKALYPAYKMLHLFANRSSISVSHHSMILLNYLCLEVKERKLTFRFDFDYETDSLVPTIYSAEKHTSTVV
jgi:hypothetical protein